VLQALICKKSNKRVRFTDENEQTRETRLATSFMSSYEILFFGDILKLGSPPKPTISNLEKDQCRQDQSRHCPSSNHQTINVSLKGEYGVLFKHNVFTLSADSDQFINPLNKQKIERRYSDFLWLWQYLKKKYPRRSVPSLPERRGIFYVGNRSDPVFLEKRRAGLEYFLIEIMSHEPFSNDSAVISFIQAPTRESFEGSKLMLLKTLQIEKI